MAKFDAEVAERFMALRERGATRERLEAEFGVSAQTVRDWARKLGVEFKGRQKVDAAVMARMRSLFEQGFSTAEIATELGVNKSTATKYLHEMDLRRSRSEAGRMGRARFTNVETAPPPTPRDGLFQPVQVLGDGPLARRYRAERGME